ncbi:MAG: hypothetical protein ABF713_07130 [Acetobacter orientalis]|uniref:hypothetical protein n=1 Tax=Acetobacter orientalis TaxID=146474 RepID=UPI0039EA667C
MPSSVPSIYIPEIKFLRPDVSIWLMYSGRNRIFLKDFQEKGVVFLNTPGFDAKENTFKNTALIARHTNMSAHISDWLNGKAEKNPSRIPESYDENPILTDVNAARIFSAELGNIKRLFVEAKVGDIVISPGKSPFDPLLVGEITHDWRKEDDYKVPHLAGEIVPCRKVAWLQNVLLKKDFSIDLAKRLQNRQAITKIDNKFYNEILDCIYPAYSRGNRSKLDIFGDNYTGNDPMQPYESASLIKYLMASSFAFENGEIEDFATLDFEAAVDKYYDKDRVIDFKQNFNSPGAYSLIVKSSIAVLIVSSGLILATSVGGGITFDQSVKAAQMSPGKSSGEIDKNSLSQENDNYLNSLRGKKGSEILMQKGKKSNDTMPLSLDNTYQLGIRRDSLK